MNEKSVCLHFKDLFLSGKSDLWLTPCDTGKFRDLFPSTQYCGNILKVCQRGLMIGTSAKKFSPAALLTKGMAVTVLYRLAGLPDRVREYTFNDVSKRAYAAAAINWACGCGLIEGKDENNFGKDEYMTKGQVMKLFRNYAFLKGKNVFETETLACSRVERTSPAWSKTAMQWAVDAGVLSVKNPLRLVSMCRVTRGEFAFMLVRFCDIYDL